MLFSEEASADVVAASFAGSDGPAAAMGLGYRCDSQRLAAYVYAEGTVRECMRRVNDTLLLGILRHCSYSPDARASCGHGGS